MRFIRNRATVNRTQVVGRRVFRCSPNRDCWIQEADWGYRRATCCQKGQRLVLDKVRLITAWIAAAFLYKKRDYYALAETV